MKSHPQNYLDNAATAWPRHPDVMKAMIAYDEAGGTSPARGQGHGAQHAGQILYDLRQAAARLFHVSKPENIILGPSATLFFNTVIRQWATTKKLILTSHFEHNAVRRPLRALSIPTIKGPPSQTSLLDPQWLFDHLKNDQKRSHTAVIVSHSCNVTGEIADLHSISKVCATFGVPLLIDGCQSAGWLFPSLDNIPNGIFIASGHKHLGGPQGTALMILGEEVSLEAYFFGGTGINSREPIQPPFRPDNFEVGTPNMLGFAGLYAALKRISPHNVTNHLISLQNILRTSCWSDESSQDIYKPSRPALPILLLAPLWEDALTQKNIVFRQGLHCNPWAHKFLGTLESGQIRISFGPQHDPSWLEAWLKEWKFFKKL